MLAVIPGNVAKQVYCQLGQKAFLKSISLVADTAFILLWLSSSSLLLSRAFLSLLSSELEKPSQLRK